MSFQLLRGFTVHWGRVEVVRMRLWSLFSEGNKTSDIPRFPNNYSKSSATTSRKLEGENEQLLYNIWRYRPSFSGNTADLQSACKGKKRKELHSTKVFRPPFCRSVQLCDGPACVRPSRHKPLSAAALFTRPHAQPHSIQVKVHIIYRFTPNHFLP